MSFFKGILSSIKRLLIDCPLVLKKEVHLGKPHPACWCKQSGGGAGTLPHPCAVIGFFVFCFFYKFIYFWLHQVFVAACGLFSSCGERGATLCCGTQASHCGGFSCCGAQASVVVAHGVSSYGSRTLERRLSSCGPRA